MWGLVGNPEDQFSQDDAQIILGRLIVVNPWSPIFAQWKVKMLLNDIVPVPHILNNHLIISLHIKPARYFNQG